MCFMTKISIRDAENIVSDIFERGVGTFIDPDNSFRKKLIAKASGTYSDDIVIKFGVDPTRPDIHLGHAVVLRKLRQMQDLGCKILFLIGDFTALIGDPTGKSKVRPEVEQSVVDANMKTYLDQVGKILRLDQDLFSWIRNSDWFYGVTDILVGPEAKLSWKTKDNEGVEREIPINPNDFVGKALIFDQTRMQTQVLKKPARGVTFATILSILRNITLAQLVERDMFQKRIQDGEALFMHEMMYPVMQGIDSSILSDIYNSCDLEVGGTDQTFNMLMGRRVMEIAQKAPQAVLAFELLVGLDGKEKMSKSLDNYVSIIDAPTDMFGKLMSIPDAVIKSYFELCTFTPTDQIRIILKDIESGKAHPKEVKMDLAQQIVEIYHGRDAGSLAREAFINTFQKKEIPEDMPVVNTTKGTLLSEVLVNSKLVTSKTEFRRLLDEGAIREGGEIKITDPFIVVNEEMTLKIGKHRFLKIIVE